MTSSADHGTDFHERPFAFEVALYLADCAAFRSLLDPRYHPTESGAVKVIWHSRHSDMTASKTAEAQIRDTFRAAATYRQAVPETAVHQEVLSA